MRWKRSGLTRVITEVFHESYRCQESTVEKKNLSLSSLELSGDFAARHHFCRGYPLVTMGDIGIVNSSVKDDRL